MDESTTPNLELDPPSEHDASTDPPDAHPQLRRSTTNKMVGGVAGGLSERYAIDANIVRVVFVVLSVIWGLGIAIYLLMWVIVPRSGAVTPERPEEPSGPVARYWLTVAVVAGAIALMVIVLTSLSGDVGRARGVVVLWALFLVVLCIVTVVRPSRRLTLRRVLALGALVAMSLAILFIGSVASFLATTNVPMEGGIGSRAWHPTTIAAVQKAYRLELGHAVVNLTGLPVTTKPVGITASVGVGDLEFMVPLNAVLDLQTNVGAGSADNPNESYVAGPSGKPAPHYVINAQVGIGQITITRIFFKP